MWICSAKESGFSPQSACQKALFLMSKAIPSKTQSSLDFTSFVECQLTKPLDIGKAI